MILGCTLANVKPLADIYRATGERAGRADSLRLAISTHFYAGADPESARAVYPYYQEYLRPKTPGGRGLNVSRTAFETGTSPDGAIMIGVSRRDHRQAAHGEGIARPGPGLRTGRLGRPAFWHGGGVDRPLRHRDRSGAAVGVRTATAVRNM